MRCLIHTTNPYFFFPPVKKVLSNAKGEGKGNTASKKAEKEGKRGGGTQATSPGME